MRISDWSSDVCSSDLVEGAVPGDGYAAISVAGTIEFPGADSVVVQYRLEGATDWTMAGEFPAISPFQQVIAPLASLGSYDVEIAYRDRKSGGSGKRLAVRVEFVGRRLHKKKKT